MFSWLFLVESAMPTGGRHGSFQTTTQPTRKHPANIVLRRHTHRLCELPVLSVRSTSGSLNRKTAQLRKLDAILGSFRSIGSSRLRLHCLSWSEMLAPSQDSPPAVELDHTVYPLQNSSPAVVVECGRVERSVSKHHAVISMRSAGQPVVEVRSTVQLKSRASRSCSAEHHAVAVPRHPGIM